MGELLQLHNGSDIRGVAVYGVKGENVNLTITEARKIGCSFALWLKQKLGKPNFCVSVGRDSRISGDELKEGLVEGLNMAGATVWDFGFASAPCMAQSVFDEELACDGAVMITGGTLPYNWSGMKFFTPDGATTGADITAILEAAEAIEAEGIDIRTQRKDYLLKYAAGLAAFISVKTNSEKPFEGSRIIVDAGNGVGGFFVDKILRPLGADTVGSRNLERNGMFPNHVPDPARESVLEQFKNTAAEYKADLGILLDTDACSAALIGKDGRKFSQSELLMLMCAIVLEENPGGAIATDGLLPEQVRAFIEKKGGVVCRPRGVSETAAGECKRLAEEGVSCAMAMDIRGLCALKENHYLNDGVFMVVKILVKFAQLKAQGKSLLDLLQ
jgi:phosphomannomutase